MAEVPALAIITDLLEYQDNNVELFVHVLFDPDVARPSKFCEYVKFEESVIKTCAKRECSDIAERPRTVRMIFFMVEEVWVN